MVQQFRKWADKRVDELVRLGEPAPKHPLAQARTLLNPRRRRKRIEVEARLLAGQTPREIGKAMSVRPEVIDWFAAAHFDVADRLESLSYIRLTCLEEPPAQTDRPPYELAKWYAFSYGVRALEAALEVLDDWQADDRVRPGLTATELAKRALRLRVRAAMLASCIPVGAFGLSGLRVMQRLTRQGRL